MKKTLSMLQLLMIAICATAQVHVWYQGSKVYQCAYNQFDSITFGATPTPEPPHTFTPFRGYITAKYHNWTWENGDQPSLEVYVVNPNPYDTVASLKLTIKSCNVLKDETIDTYTKQISLKANDSIAVYISPSKTLSPDIYKASLKLDNKSLSTYMLNWDGKKSITSFNIAVDPAKIASPYDGQSDYDQFWKDTKAELRALYNDHQVKMTKLKEVNNSTIYLCQAQSIKLDGDSGIVRFYYSEPNKSGTYPCLIQFPGYDQPNDPFSCPLWGNASQCEMYVCPRGQYVNARAPYTNQYGEWIKYGIKSKQTYYYRGAYMDAVRAVDFVFSRSNIDTTQVFALGSSQGGALTLAAAALSDHQFAAISVCVPFLGDWPDFMKLSWGYPVYIREAAKDAGITEAEALQVLSYIDTKNLAHLITCPVQEMICLQDDVCPPHTNASIYPNLTACPDKDEQLYISPLENHAWAQGWDDLREAFFKKYKK